jgi:hypothetical protein
LLLANQFAPVASPLAAKASESTPHADSALDFVMNQAELDSILRESDVEFQLMSAALLV